MEEIDLHISWLFLGYPKAIPDDFISHFLREWVGGRKLSSSRSSRCRGFVFVLSALSTL